MKSSYILIARNPNINSSNTGEVYHRYKEQQVTLQTIAPNEVFNKSFFGIFVILILLRTKKQSLHGPTTNLYETPILNVPVLNTVETTSFFNSIYPIIWLGLFGITLYLTLYILLFPLSSAYKYYSNYYSNIKIFITTVKKRFFFIVNQINNIIYLSLNPSIRSGEDLKRAQDLLSNKEEIVKYFIKAAAIQKLAKENNVSLTINNNGSFRVFPNKSVSVDMWRTNHVRDLIIDQIASRRVNKNTSQSSFFPGAHAFNTTLFTEIKRQLFIKLNEEILSNSSSPHYSLIFLNNSVVFFNKTTVKRISVGSFTLLLKQPISCLTRNVIKLSSQNLPFLLKKPNFQLRVLDLSLKFKDSLGNLLPPLLLTPLRKVKKYLLRVFEPVSELALVKQQILAFLPDNTYSKYLIIFFLKQVPDSYLELFFFGMFYTFIQEYLTHFLNLTALRIVNTFTAELDKIWNNTEAENLYKLNHEDSFQGNTIHND
jgi:hypothetical protein